jgi:hypothetical protein
MATITGPPSGGDVALVMGHLAANEGDAGSITKNWIIFFNYND